MSVQEGLTEYRVGSTYLSESTGKGSANQMSIVHGSTELGSTENKLT